MDVVERARADLAAGRGRPADDGACPTAAALTAAVPRIGRKDLLHECRSAGYRFVVRVIGANGAPVGRSRS